MFELSEQLRITPALRWRRWRARRSSSQPLLVRWFHECARRYIEYHAHAERKIRVAAFIGLITFPIFYFVWEYALPQPYESMTLRGTGMGLCLLLAVSIWWPESLQRFVVPFAYFTYLYCLPFFFTLMLLLNHSNATWQMSTLAALIYVVLLYDLINAIIVLIVGSVAAVIAYLLMTNGSPIPSGYWLTLPILFFALTGFFGLAYGDNLIAREKLKAAASLASQVAHECRTPLGGIRLESDGCERVLAKMPESKERDRLIASHNRIRQHITSTNSVIDLLLSNVAQHHRSVSIEERHRMGEIVRTALERFHFKPQQRELVHTELDDDFEFRGSDVLMMHVLFNLMKNGLRAIEAGGSEQGALTIRLRRGRNANSLSVSDTGDGIPPELLNYVFIPFVSAQRPGVGTGLGLSFCRMIVESCGGTISCRSKRHAGTTFTIDLPVVAAMDKEAPVA